MESARQVHPIAPVWNAESRLLILGSFPSVASRETGFFYGHPQNRFWRVTAAVWESPVPETVPEKTAFLLAHGIALWDVIASCTVAGSSDSSIRQAVPNDLSPLLRGSSIRRIAVNGGTAAALYDRFLQPQTGLDALRLPSTSPANAAWSFDRLCAAWGVLRDV